MTERSQIQYVPIAEYTQKVTCNAMCLNQQSTILVIGLGKRIGIYDFVEGQIKQRQLLKKHKRTIQVLQFMKKSNQFLSGSCDGFVGFWSFENTLQQYKCMWIKQEDKLDCLQILINNEENLIVSLGGFRKIRFRKEENNWKKSFVLICDQFPECMCFNNDNNLFVYCDIKGFMKIYSISDSFTLRKKQTIQGEQTGGICFVESNILALKIDTLSQIQLFKQKNNELFELLQKIEQSPFCNHVYTKTFICFCKQKSLFICAMDDFYGIFSFGKNEQLSLEQLIYSDNLFSATATSDGEYLIVWDGSSNLITVRKYQKLN